MLAVLGREHQDRRPDLLVTQALAHPVPVQPGEHDVQHDHVVAALAGHPQPLLTVASHLYLESLGSEATLYGVDKTGLVVDQQYLHPITVSHPT